MSMLTNGNMKTVGRTRLIQKECSLVPYPGYVVGADFGGAGYIAHTLFLGAILLDRMLSGSGYDDIARPAWLDEDRDTLNALYEVSVFAESVKDGTKGDP